MRKRIAALCNHSDFVAKHWRRRTPTKSEGQIVQESKSQEPQVPPEVARYLKGPSPEGQQFDFLIGEWDIAATRYKDDGTPLFQYKASWNAKHLNEGRMIVDDFNLNP